MKPTKSATVIDESLITYEAYDHSKALPKPSRKAIVRFDTIIDDTMEVWSKPVEVRDLKIEVGVLKPQRQVNAGSEA